jgi:hypothetical protein
MSLVTRALLFALLVLSMAAFAAPAFDDRQPRPVTRVFQLKELLEHAYTDELVSFPVAFAPGECRTASLRLLDEGGKALTYQLSEVQEDGVFLRKAKVWFWVDSLPAMGQRSFTLYGSKSPACKAPKWPASPILCSQLAADTVEVTNGVFSLRLAGNASFAEPKNAKDVGGPLRGFKGPDGVWRGAGELQVESPVAGQSLRIVEQGPLWTTFASRLEFVSPPGTGGTAVGPYYEMSFQLFDDRDFCKVHEKSDFPLRLQPMPRDVTSPNADPAVNDNWRTVPCPADNFLLNCEKEWGVDRMYTHLVFSTAFVNHPLDRYRNHTALRSALPYMNGSWFSTYSTKGKDLLGMVGIDASHWQYPDNSAHYTAGTPGRDTDIMFINEPGRGAYFRLPLSRMERHWLLVVTDKNKVVKDADWVAKQKRKSNLRWFPDRIGPDTCYLWQLRYQYGDLPLNKVKDWKLDYVEPQANHPNLFPETKDRAAMIKNLDNFPGLKKHFDIMYNSSEYLQYLKTGEFKYKGDFDPFSAIGCVKENLEQGYNAYMYVLSTGQYVPGMIKFCDIVAPGMSKADWEKMNHFGLAGTYLLADDDYWQYTYVRGDTTYLPNFNTCRWSGIGLAGLFFTGHPDSKKWIDFSRYYLEKEFDYHISKDGVGAENVGNYYPFAWRMMSELVKIMHDRGIADYRNDPKYVAGTRFWLDVITPPDPRFTPPRRMVPPVGNHPYSAPNFGMYEWNANLQQDLNPDLAAWSHWAWNESGQQPDYIHFLPFTMFLAKKEFTTAVPPLQSKPLQDFGYIFRNHFPSDKETYMSFKAGNFYFHYDQDEGSFHMFGKGVPLAADGLELIGYTKANVHNMVEIPEPGGKPGDYWGACPRGGEMANHFESPAVDWAQGFFAKENNRKADMIVAQLHTTDWRRDIVLVKAKNPEDAEYFAVYDNLNGPDKSFWNLDVHSEEPTIEPAANGTLCTVRYPGIRKPQFNVGMDLIFITPASPVIEKVKGTINKDQVGSFPQVEHWQIHSPRSPNEDTFTILFPRRPNTPAPKVTSILDGKGCIVEHPNGRDIIILSPVPVTYAANGVEFTGRCAVVRDRPGEGSITLLDGSRLAFKGKVLTEKGNIDL